MYYSYILKICIKLKETEVEIRRGEEMEKQNT